MRIAILIARFPPSYLGGAEIASYHIAKQLHQKNHEIHVVTIMDKKISNDNVEDGFFVHRMKTLNLPFIGNLIYTIRTIDLIKKIRPDLIHSQSISFHNAGLPAFIIKKIMKIPIVVRGQGFESLQGFNKLFAGIFLNCVLLWVY